MRLTVLRRLHELVGRVNSGRSLAETLQAVVDGVVEGVGFEVAAVNHVHPDGTFETVAVAGNDEARTALLGQRYTAEAFAAELARSEQWGALHFVPHDRFDSDVGLDGWIPQLDMVDAPDAWHPLDALFVPLCAPSGTLVGMLSVDVPNDGRRPGPTRRELLEMFAAQAGIAIDNARLTEQLRREQDRLRASEESFRLAFDGAGVGMTMISLGAHDRGRFLRVNTAMCRITGYSAEELTGRRFTEITHPEDVAADVSAIERALAGDDSVYRGEKRYLRPDGSIVWVSIHTSVVRDTAGEPLYAISQIEDISLRKAAEIELARRATHDPLTGLANRQVLRERLSMALDRVGRNGGPGAVLFCDLDGFKDVNDLLGHHAGDEVLSKVARRLADEVRGGDTVARLGGDEFVVIAEDIAPREVEALAERIQQAVARPVLHDGHQVAVTVSIGIAEITDSGSGPDEVLRRADEAMYRAKAAGRDGYAFAAL